MFSACCHCGNDCDNTVDVQGKVTFITCSDCGYTSVYTVDLEEKSVKVQVFDTDGKAEMNEDCLKFFGGKNSDIEKKEGFVEVSKETSGIELSDILKNRQLRESVYSTFRCQKCGQKMKASPLRGVDSVLIRFECPNAEHAFTGCRITMSLSELCSVMNFNPLT